VACAKRAVGARRRQDSALLPYYKGRCCRSRRVDGLNCDEGRCIAAVVERGPSTARACYSAPLFIAGGNGVQVDPRGGSLESAPSASIAPHWFGATQSQGCSESTPVTPLGSLGRARDEVAADPPSRRRFGRFTARASRRRVGNSGTNIAQTGLYTARSGIFGAGGGAGCSTPTFSRVRGKTQVLDQIILKIMSPTCRLGDIDIVPRRQERVGDRRRRPRASRPKAWTGSVVEDAVRRDAFREVWGGLNSISVQTDKEAYRS